MDTYPPLVDAREADKDGPYRARRRGGVARLASPRLASESGAGRFSQYVAPSVDAMDVPQITLGSINVEAADPSALARFWATITGGMPSPAHDSVYLPPAVPGGFAMFFQPLTGPRPNRLTIHVDLTVPWGTRSRQVDRLVSVGATRCWDVLDEHPHVQWTTMADPEGNLFCVAEHPPSA